MGFGLAQELGTIVGTWVFGAEDVGWGCLRIDDD